MIPLPLPPTGLPGLEPLLNGTLWGDWVEEGKVFPVPDLRQAIRYVRLKPSTSCRLFVLGESAREGAQPPPGVLLHLYPDAGRAHEAFEKVSTRPRHPDPEIRPPFLCDRHAAVGVPFPDDPLVPGLRHFYRPHRLRLALEEILTEYPPPQWRLKRSTLRLRLLAYKPGRRAVHRVDVQALNVTDQRMEELSLHVKVESPHTCGRSHGNLAAVHAAAPHEGTWRVPAPRGLVATRGMVVSEWIDGVPLADVLPAHPGAATATLARVGGALAALHGARIGAGAIGAEPLESPATHGRNMADMLPGHAETIVSLGERLASQWQRLGTGPAVLHGDFHPGQVIMAGERMALVDFDRAHHGHPAQDLGNFLAHLLEVEGRQETQVAFLDGYRRAAASRIDERDVALATATALFRRAPFAFRQLRPDWQERMLRDLEQVETLMAKGTS